MAAPPLEKSGRKIVVLDTSAFVAGLDPFSIAEEQISVPKVEEEIRRKSLLKTRLETAVESGKLKIREPSSDFFASVKYSAAKVGDAFKLSEADLQLLALALQLKSECYTPQIVTDDYCIQNVARQLGFGYVTLATFGIKKQLDWVKYCPACYREYSGSGKERECLVCGTALKRKPRRTRKAVS